MWEEVVRRSKAEGFEVATLPDFSALLEGDRRFQIIPAQIKNQEDREESGEGELTDIEMEQLGFLFGRPSQIANIACCGTCGQRRRRGSRKHKTASIYKPVGTRGKNRCFEEN